MDIQSVKKFLHVDYDDDDELIELMISAAKDYIINAVGKYDDNKPLMRLLLLNLVTGMYDTRTYTISQTEKQQYTTNSIVLQLQLQEETEE